MGTPFSQGVYEQYQLSDGCHVNFPANISDRQEIIKEMEKLHKTDGYMHNHKLRKAK